MNEKKGILTRTSVSLDLKNPESFKEAVNSLKEVVNKIDDEGVLYVILNSRKDKYTKDSKIIRDILDLPFLYSREKMQRKPELANEFVEIYNHIKEISKIVEKRRKANKKRFLKSKEKNNGSADTEQP